MRSSSREGVVEVFDALSAAVEAALELDFDALTPRECVAILRRCETLRRRLPAVEHPLITALGTADPGEIGGRLRAVLADELLISRGEAGRRIAAAADLGHRRGLTGEPLDPVLPTVAAAQRDGWLGSEHVQVIQDFFAYLSNRVAVGERIQAEIDLAGYATELRPDQLHPEKLLRDNDSDDDAP